MTRSFYDIVFTFSFASLPFTYVAGKFRIIISFMPIRRVMAFYSPQIFQKYLLFCVQLSRMFIFLYESFMCKSWPMLFHYKLFPSWSRTAFSLNFEEWMNNRQFSGLYAVMPSSVHQHYWVAYIHHTWKTISQVIFHSYEEMEHLVYIFFLFCFYDSHFVIWTQKALLCSWTDLSLVQCH
jgi:hypothetical protein